MATVRITSDMRIIVKNNIKALFNDQLNKATGMPVVIDAEYLYTKMFGAYLEAMNRLPSNFFRSIHCINVRHVHGIPLNQSATLPKVSIVPVRIDETQASHFNLIYVGADSWTVDLLPNEDELWEDLLTQTVARHHAVSTVTKQIKDVESSADYVLGKCSTLSQALKVWPALWEVLPDTYKAKHEAKVEKKLRVEPAIGIDLASATGVLAVRRMSR